MKKILILAIFAVLLSSIVFAVKPATPVCGNGVQEPSEQCDDGNTVSGDGCSSDCKKECTPGSGAIWTTKNDCGDVTQNVNQYASGDKVYINGNNFCEDTYDWAITGQPGGASCDPKIVVASGNQAVDSSGAFCIEAYTVANDDCGEYTVDFGKKNDNYQVPGIPIPEFTTIGAGIALVGASLYYFKKRK